MENVTPEHMVSALAAYMIADFNAQWQRGIQQRQMLVELGLIAESDGRFKPRRKMSKAERRG